MKLVENKKTLLDTLSMYLLKGKREAILLTLLFSFIPYFSFMAMISIGIITLRQGLKNGAFVVLVVMLPLLCVAAYQHHLILGIEQCLATLGVSWVFAAALRLSCSWSLVMTTAVILSLVTGGLISLLYPNHIADSRYILNQLLDLLSKQGSSAYDTALIKSNINWFAEYFLGAQILITTTVALSNLAIARYIQSKAFNPGGFSQEFLNFRLSYLNALLFFVSILAMLLDVAFVKTFILVSILPVIASGISFMHWRIKRWPKRRLMILLPSYFLLIAFPFSFLLLMAVGIMDMWLDFRNFQFRS